MAGQNEKTQSHDEVAINGTEPSNESENDNIIEEYVTLDSQLDELNSALDYLEKKNDNIHEKLKELLQSNIEIRQQFQNEKNMETEEQN